ncbi:heme ABC transporter permease CcmC [Solemya velesiana gill symbiont]|uniref:Heme exporter protein C n=1 Tax=Solemya velesiana gill symbiont TaxID=1918948 RepID=A0A1T2KWU8_9GAMM|nr:heme ABC transporter permease CcmC [Solemya velesiana gill symbiont]OOZ37328.1 heme ABC transporter permease [Solemya velesiana gill symbiont]
MSSRILNWFKFSSPATFYPLAGRIGVWSMVIAVVLIVVGLYMSFFVAPTDYKQGEGYRIIYVHVPAAWMSMFIYLVMAFWSVLGIIYNTRLSAMMTSALAPTGAMFAFLSLWTGAFWGKPMWGTWWVWDARLTSALILFFLYLGYIALQGAIDDTRRSDRAGALLVLVGVVNIPIIYFSVKWWNTLHQGATIKMSGEASMDPVMLWTMLIMTFGFWAYAIATAMSRVRSIILERERETTWVSELPEVRG